MLRRTHCRILIDDANIGYAMRMLLALIISFASSFEVYRNILKRNLFASTING